MGGQKLDIVALSHQVQRRMADDDKRRTSVEWGLNRNIARASQQMVINNLSYACIFLRVFKIVVSNGKVRLVKTGEINLSSSPEKNECIKVDVPCSEKPGICPFLRKAKKNSISCIFGIYL